jgi:uncharacterized protein YjbI with pentapeptide repeats
MFASLSLFGRVGFRLLPVNALFVLPLRYRSLPWNRMSQITRDEILGRASTGEGLRGANLVRADLASIEMARADLAEANLRMADLSGADLTEARLNGSFLSGASLTDAILVGANLVEASVIGAILERADLSRADLSGADLTGANLKGAQLVGAYLVGTFLNETDLSGANLNGAYIRMSQMGGSNLSGATLEGSDLSHANLSGACLDGCCLAKANLTGANLSASVLKGCDLRDADLSDADLTGCNLTGAKLSGIKCDGAKLADAWAEWVDLSPAGKEEERAPLEEAFIGLVGRPFAQLLVEGHVGDEVWAAILAHLCAFREANSQHSDISLKAIHQGASSSALYLEAELEMSLAAYLAEFADIIGTGSLELFDKLAGIIGGDGHNNVDRRELAAGMGALALDSIQGDSEGMSEGRPSRVSQVVNSASEARIEILQRTGFWRAEKAIAILTGTRQVWLEAASSESLTLRPPHGAALGIDIVSGRFVTEESRRRKK